MNVTDADSLQPGEEQLLLEQIGSLSPKMKLCGGMRRKGPIAVPVDVYVEQK